MRRAGFTVMMASLLLAWSVPAEASSYFNFRGCAPLELCIETFDNSNPFSLTVDGITVTATGHSTGGVDRGVHRASQGLGVFDGLPDSIQTDGLDVDEILRLTFSEEVGLLSATFTRLSDGDEATLEIDGSAIGQILDFGGIQLDIGTMTVDITGFTTATGIVFDFGVTDENDDWKLGDVTAQAVVPEPTTLLLLGSGLLGGFGALRKRLR